MKNQFGGNRRKVLSWNLNIYIWNVFRTFQNIFLNGSLKHERSARHTEPRRLKYEHETFAFCSNDAEHSPMYILIGSLPYLIPRHRYKIGWGSNKFSKLPKPHKVGTHWKALDEMYPMVVWVLSFEEFWRNLVIFWKVLKIPRSKWVLIFGRNVFHIFDVRNVFHAIGLRCKGGVGVHLCIKRISVCPIFHNFWQSLLCDRWFWRFKFVILLLVILAKRWVETAGLKWIDPQCWILAVERGSPRCFPNEG